MRRTISVPVMIVGTTAAVLVVMVGVGIGQPIFSHGGTPTDVYSQTLGSPNDEVCAESNVDGRDVMQQQFEVTVPSLVVAVASFDWEGLSDQEIGEPTSDWMSFIQASAVIPGPPLCLPPSTLRTRP